MLFFNVILCQQTTTMETDSDINCFNPIESELRFTIYNTSPPLA